MTDYPEKFTATLSPQARILFDLMQLEIMDWHDTFHCLQESLTILCEVLRGYESPAWGNVSARYDYSGGLMTAEDWEAVDAQNYEHEVGFTPLSYAVIAAGHYAATSPTKEAALVELADALREEIRTLNA